MNNKGFSIVICTYNGGSKIEATLQHLALLIKPGLPVEIILVDNASTDGTSTISKDYWAQLNNPFPLKILNEPRPGKGYAIEKAYDASQYAYIITVDDDNWLAKEYLMVAIGLIEKYPDVGIFQARNEAVFEHAPPPEWVTEVKDLLVIGSPVKNEGYFPANYYGVWGAGMILMQNDWIYLRKKGFSAITSKIPGKAAGEDVELAIAILLSGKKIFYSESLFYQHYMPSKRIEWDNFLQSFKGFSYTDYYFLIYSIIFDSYKKKQSVKNKTLKTQFFKHWLKLIKSRGLKDNFRYFFTHEKHVYQLLLKRYYTLLYWYWKLAGKSAADIKFIQRWMIPLLEHNPNNFSM